MYYSTGLGGMTEGSYQSKKAALLDQGKRPVTMEVEATILGALQDAEDRSEVLEILEWSTPQYGLDLEMILYLGDRNGLRKAFWPVVTGPPPAPATPTWVVPAAIGGIILLSAFLWRMR